MTEIKMDETFDGWLARFETCCLFYMSLTLNVCANLVL